IRPTLPLSSDGASNWFVAWIYRCPSRAPVQIQVDLLVPGIGAICLILARHRSSSRRSPFTHGQLFSSGTSHATHCALHTQTPASWHREKVRSRVHPLQSWFSRLDSTQYIPWVEGCASSNTHAHKGDYS